MWRCHCALCWLFTVCRDVSNLPAAAQHCNQSQQARQGWAPTLTVSRVDACSALVAEVMLFSEGFEDSKVLSRKMVQLYKLASEQLSQQVGILSC